METLHYSKHQTLICLFCLAIICPASLLYADDRLTSPILNTVSWLDKTNISGYANLVTTSPNHAPTTVELDDLSLFISGKYNRWLNPFIEAELCSTKLFEAGKGVQFNQQFSL